MVKNEAVDSTIKQLQLLSVCPRCILRFLSVRSYISYISKEEVQRAIADFVNPDDSAINVNTSEESKDGNPVPKRPHPNPCTSCLGALQDDCDQMASEVENSVKKSGFHFTDFVIQLSLPVSIDLRQSLIILYLKEKLGPCYEANVDRIPSVKEVWKWVVGTHVSKAVNADFSPKSNFQITVSVLHPDMIAECKSLLKSCPEAFPNRNKGRANPGDIYNRTSVSKAIDMLSSELKNLYPLPPLPPDKCCTYEDVVCTHSPLYLGGRYNKYSRELSQTPWVVDGERRMELSVQELITDIVSKSIVCDSIVFSASGREDVDVKMLGSGRPFVLEIVNPRRIQWTRQELKAIENAINENSDAIAIRAFQIISKSDIQYLKEGEEQKRKTYIAICSVKKFLSEQDLLKLGGLTDITVKQKTPIRVLHRRTLATRDRIIHKMDGTILGPHQLKLKVETQAGTYVKEFVHSDFGRTVPSLGTLLDTEADILELDVESIHLDWPPSISSDLEDDKDQMEPSCI